MFVMFVAHTRLHVFMHAHIICIVPCHWSVPLRTPHRNRIPPVTRALATYSPAQCESRLFSNVPALEGEETPETSMAILLPSCSMCQGQQAGVHEAGHRSKPHCCGSPGSVDRSLAAEMAQL